MVSLLKDPQNVIFDLRLFFFYRAPLLFCAATEKKTMGREMRKKKQEHHIMEIGSGICGVTSSPSRIAT